MATNKVKFTEGTAIVWADTTDYSNTITGLARTHQIDLTSVAAAASRQGAKADLGATRSRQYLCFVAFEIASAAASDEQIDVYWAGSPHATADNANPGGTTGADAAYTGTAGDSLADSVKQLRLIGSLTTTADNTTVVQYQTIGVLLGDTLLRYGMPVVVNNSTGALVANAVEMLIALIPMDDDIQAAA